MAYPILALGASLSSPVVGNGNGTQYAMADLADEKGVVIFAHGIGWAHTLPTNSGIFQQGCYFIETDSGSQWVNVAAATSSASWVNRY